MKTSSNLLSRQSGIVLPVVLVVLVVVTTLVLTQVRRGTVDERLAGNWSRSISGETGAESTLRWCEMELQREPRLWDGVIRAADLMGFHRRVEIRYRWHLVGPHIPLEGLVR